MKVRCVQAKLGRCNEKSKCGGYDIIEKSTYNMQEFLRAAKYCRIHPSKFIFYVLDEYNEEECKRLLFEANLRYNFING